MFDEIITKQCSRCKQIKPVSEFYKNQTRSGRIQGYCKICQAIYGRKYEQTPKRKEQVYRYTNSVRGREIKRRAERERSKNPVYKEKKRRYRESPTGKQVQKQASKKYYQSAKGQKVRKAYKAANRDKIRAGGKVSTAIQYKHLPNPKDLHCANCGKRARDYHHPSYEKEHWLDVIPLCKRCHIKSHLVHTHNT